MKESTRQAIARLEPILAENAGNRLTYAVMRGLHQQMTEMLVEVLEAPEPATGLAIPEAPARGAQLVASGEFKVDGDAG